ncbi:MAG: hypothetical protein OJF59_000241 [Cytophagales bacterium]|jgi:hypothetical protein|nr:hypothetical protein [Bacteroidota bacterium]MBS1981256.1 hypothetical protein [Bacteroidota bacterium]WHZ06488.1 MAG: hypothetical protein OJF59_000241 [Cytophagales bacterium]
MVVGFRKGGSGYVLVKITQSLFNNQTNVVGMNGKTLNVDTTFDKARNARIDGEVIQLPLYLGNAMISQII